MRQLIVGFSCESASIEKLDTYTYILLLIKLIEILRIELITHASQKLLFDYNAIS